jgi:hypothetical protein
MNRKPAFSQKMTKPSPAPKSVVTQKTPGKNPKAPGKGPIKPNYSIDPRC